MSQRTPSPIVVTLLIGVLCSIWGTTYFVIREGLNDLTPLHAAAWRFSVAAALFTLLAPFVHPREGGERAPLWLSAVMGIGVGGIPYGLVYWSELHVPSGLASVLWGTFPMMMAVAGHYLLANERLTVRGSCGLLLGFAGVVSLFFTDLRALGPEVAGAGAILLLSPFIATFGQVTIKRSAAGISSVLLNRNGAWISATVLWLGALLFEPDAELNWSTTALLSVAYLAVVATVLAFGLYYWLLRTAPLGQMAMIAYIVPAIALTVGAGLGNEPVGTTTILGALLITAGVWIVTDARQKAAKRAAAAS